MAEGKWITVPANKTRSGQPETRWQMPDGEIRLTQPGLLNWSLRDVVNLNDANRWGYTPPGGAKASQTNSSSQVKDSSGRDDQGADLNLGADWTARAQNRQQLASEGKLQTETSKTELPAQPARELFFWTHFQTISSFP